MRIAVTGATGFIGRRVVASLADAGHYVIPIVRRDSGIANGVNIGDLATVTSEQISTLSNQCDGFVHLAACTRAKPGQSDNRIMHSTNVIGSLNAVRLARQMHAKCFVFLSSAKVHGESTGTDKPFYAIDALRPVGAYAQSKVAAEHLLRAEAQKFGMDLVILRPPLVYGASATGNFQWLVWLATSGIPLPIANLQNARSMIYVDNLADAIKTALERRTAAMRPLLVSDDYNWSTGDLMQAIATARGNRFSSFSVPSQFFGMAQKIPIFGTFTKKLLGNLTVDCKECRRELGWHPPISPLLAIAKSVAPA